MKLGRYLERIGYQGAVEPSLEVLREVHRHHLFAIPYENIDVQLGRPVDQDRSRIYDKIVDRGRGGWCYEMNGLLAWALEEIGFSVTRMVGGVMRRETGDKALGNHLVLAVELDGPWIVDVGLGDGILEPIPLSESEFEQAGRRYRLERLTGDEWRFHNRTGGQPTSFDLVVRPAEEARLSQACHDLQSNPESMFRQNLICTRMSEKGLHLMLGRVLRHQDFSSPATLESRVLVSSLDDFREVLVDIFGLEGSSFEASEIEALWSQVITRHQTLFGDSPIEEITFGAPSPGSPHP